MDNKLMESYLDNIAEQVVDEDKIVTYKSLSKSLGIHVNTAKQLLYTYLTNEKSKNSFPISATYLIAGKVVDGSVNIAIVKEDDLKNAHSNFIEVTSEHVYSVQKGKNLKELKVLSAVDKESFNSKSSNVVIKCSKGILKSRGTVKEKPESIKQDNKEVIRQALVSEKQPVKIEKPTSVPEKTQTPTTNETSSKSSKKTSPKGNSEKGAKKPTANIANLFAKAAQKTAVKTVKLDKKDDVMEVEIHNGKEDKAAESKTERGDTDKKNEKDSSKKKKKGSKRRRIQMLSDSEESDSEDEETVNVEEDEEPLPSPVDLECEKEEVKDPTPRNKRKKRKVIDKTVMNEDGYLETRKEVVFETDSENDAEEVTTAPKEQKKPKVDSIHDKGKATKKQASLLTFFKKS